MRIPSLHHVCVDSHRRPASGAETCVARHAGTDKQRQRADAAFARLRGGRMGCLCGRDRRFFRWLVDIAAGMFDYFIIVTFRVWRSCVGLFLYPADCRSRGCWRDAARTGRVVSSGCRGDRSPCEAGLGVLVAVRTFSILSGQPQDSCSTSVFYL